MDDALEYKEKILEICRTEEEPDEYIEENLITEENWPLIQKALFKILLDPASSAEICEYVANIFWGAVLDERPIKKRTAVALLYDRLGDVENPYENNTIWSITCKLYDLDYCNSMYNPLKDPRILHRLALFGISPDQIQKR